MKHQIKYHKYEPLQPGFIRLLKIYHTGPSQTFEQMRASSYPFEQELIVSLETFSLEDCPSYMTLSYTWGLPGTAEDPDLGCFTQVSRVFPIYDTDTILLGTWNLRDALRHLRFLLEIRDNVLEFEHALVRATRQSLGDVSYFWVDALCINQEDLNERAIQVQLMGEIYKQATLTIVWLGMADKHTSIAFEVLKRVEDHIGDASAKSRAADKGVEIEPVSVDEEGMEACIALFNRQWFSRNRVSQEAALSSKVFMLLGDKLIPVLIFERARTLVQLGGYMASGLQNKDEDQRKAAMHRQSAFTNIRYLTYLEAVRASARRGQLSDLFMILSMCRNQQCFDPHDKIYSILGICSEFASSGEDRIVPDYTIDLHTLYVQATRVAIRARDDLLILNHVGAEKRLDGLPSWCPDYQNLSTPVINVYFARPQVYKLSTNRSRVCHVIESNLYVLGQCISTIREGVVFKTWGTQPAFSGPVAILDLLSRVDTQSGNGFRHVLQNMSRVEILWRTLLSRCGTVLANSFDLEDAEKLPPWAALLFPVYLRALILWRLSARGLSVRRAGEKWEGSNDLQAYADAFESSLMVMLTLEPQNRYFLPSLEETRHWCAEVDDWNLMTTTLLDLNVEDRRAWYLHAESLRIDLPESFIFRPNRQYWPGPTELNEDDTTVLNWIFGFQDSFTNLVPAKAFRTDDHLFGIASCPLEAEDQLWVLHGAHAPVILRPLSNGNFTYIGETYMYGMMNGEAVPLCTNPISIVIE